MITLAQITMNVGDGIPGSVIKWNLKKNAHRFDRVMIVDGQLTDEAREFYKQFDNLEVIDSPWTDSYVKQYQAFADKLIEGEWCLYLDCDEIPSEELLIGMQTKMVGDTNIIRLPCILHITEDGEKYYPVESRPSLVYQGQWTKNILFRKDDGLFFRHFGSHVIPENQHGNYDYWHGPYYHMKSLESFVYNDVWQAFLSPEGQGYTPIEAAQFKMFTKQYKTTAEFKKATKEGTWPIPLQMFARKKSHEFDRPISRLAWVYYLLEDHPDFWSDNEMRRWDSAEPIPGMEGWLNYPDPLTWEYVKQFVLGKESMELLSENREKNNFIEIVQKL